jgi:hypothetical protein
MSKERLLINVVTDSEGSQSMGVKECDIGGYDPNNSVCELCRVLFIPNKPKECEQRIKEMIDG